MLFGMTERDLKKIEERLNALSRVVAEIADKLKLEDDPNSTASLFDLNGIRFDLHLGRD